MSARRASRRAARPHRAAAGAAPGERPGAGAWAVLATLAATGLLHLAAPAVPEGWAWAVRWIQWLPVASGVLALAAAMTLLLPGVGRRLAPPATMTGVFLSRTPLAGGALLGVLLVALVLRLPDETQMTGDFLLRLGLVREGERAEVYSPQSLPLDVLVNQHFARSLAGPLGGEQGASRALGGVWAFGLGLAAAALARALAVDGAAALVVAVLAAGGGALGLCTGYPKAFGPLAVLGVAAVAAAFAAARGRSPLPLALVVAIALLWHRSALVLLPLWATGTWLATRAGTSGRVPLVAAWLLPPAAFALAAPQTLHTLGGYDAARHLAHAPFGLLAIADRLQVVLLYAPLALVALAALFALRPAWRSARTHVALAVLVPSLLLLFAVQPQQGVPRDWDVYAVGGGALAALVAAAVGRGVAQLRGGPALAAGLVALALVFAFQPLAAQNDTAAGAARAQQIAEGPPLRAEAERALLWDYLGIRAANAQDLRAAGDAWAEAARLAPSPRLLRQWGWSELGARRLERAQQAYDLLVARDSTSRAGWIGLFSVALGRRDEVAARAVLARVVAQSPKHPGNDALREALQRLEARNAASGGPR